MIWFWFPETARRSLEEIDVIFAKGYAEKISYVKAAEELPCLKPEEVEGYARRYGLIGEEREEDGNGRGKTLLGQDGTGMAGKREVHGDGMPGERGPRLRVKG